MSTLGTLHQGRTLILDSCDEFKFTLLFQTLRACRPVIAFSSLTSAYRYIKNAPPNHLFVVTSYPTRDTNLVANLINPSPPSPMIFNLRLQSQQAGKWQATLSRITTHV